MNYRGIINMLMLCGCIGQSGGGWAHHVGQEKLRPQTGWTALAFALDWIRPPRQMNSTSFFYAHTDQWRYEKLGMEEILSPWPTPAPTTVPRSTTTCALSAWAGCLPLPSSRPTPCRWPGDAAAAGMDAKDYVVKSLRRRQPDHELRGPRPPRQLAAQHVRVALQHPGLVGQGA